MLTRKVANVSIHIGGDQSRDGIKVCTTKSKLQSFNQAYQNSIRLNILNIYSLYVIFVLEEKVYSVK